MKTLNRKLNISFGLMVIVVLIGVSCNNASKNDSLNPQKAVLGLTLPINNSPIQGAVIIESPYYIAENDYSYIPILVNLDLDSGFVKIAIPALSQDDSVKVYQGDNGNQKVIDIEVDSSLVDTPWESTCYVKVKIDNAEKCTGVLVRLFSKSGDNVSLIAEKDVEAETVYNPGNPELTRIAEIVEDTIIEVAPHFMQMFSMDSVLFLPSSDNQNNNTEITATFFDEPGTGNFQVLCDTMNGYLVFHIDRINMKNTNTELVYHKIKFQVPADLAQPKQKGKYKNSRRNCKTITIPVRKIGKPSE